MKFYNLGDKTFETDFNNKVTTLCRFIWHYKVHLRSGVAVCLVNYENLPNLYFDSKYQKFFVRI